MDPRWFLKRRCKTQPESGTWLGAEEPPEKTPYAITMEQARRVVKLEHTLDLMRREAALRQLAGDENWALYNCAAECVEEEWCRAKTEAVP